MLARAVSTAFATPGCRSQHGLAARISPVATRFGAPCGLPDSLRPTFTRPTCLGRRAISRPHALSAALSGS